MATATARTDIHRPSAAEFDPQAYTLVGCYDNDWLASSRQCALDVEVLQDNGLTIGHGSSRQCGHCGTHIKYAALLVRDDGVAREYIFVGETCLDGRFTLAKEEFQKLRKSAEIRRKCGKIEEKLAKFLESCEVARVLSDNGEVVRKNDFLSDLRRKLYTYGDLSPRQVSAAERCIVGEKRRAEWAAKRAEEKAALAAAGVEAPEGRVEFEGEVVTVKEHYGRFGTVTKIVVKASQGWSCWVSLPIGIDRDSVRGKRVKLTASLTRSDKDKTFAFGKRPSGFEVL